jgi:hypothetical protein
MWIKIAIILLAPLVLCGIVRLYMWLVEMAIQSEEYNLRKSKGEQK